MCAVFFVQNYIGQSLFIFTLSVNSHVAAIDSFLIFLCISLGVLLYRIIKFRKSINFLLVTVSFITHYEHNRVIDFTTMSTILLIQ